MRSRSRLLKLWKWKKQKHAKKICKLWQTVLVMGKLLLQESDQNQYKFDGHRNLYDYIKDCITHPCGSK